MVTWHGLAARLGIPYTRTIIAIIFVLLLLVGAGLACTNATELRQEWREKRKFFLMIEGLFLGFFLFDLLIRIGNPDLWHPAKGGERPMDFSYFNAVIKSTSFPPYDPWFAGWIHQLLLLWFGAGWDTDQTAGDCPIHCL